MRNRVLCPVLFLLLVLSALPLCAQSANEVGVFPCGREPTTKRTAVLTSTTGASAYLQVHVEIVETNTTNGEPVHKCRAFWTLMITPSSVQPATATRFHEYTEPEFRAAFEGDSVTYYDGAVLGWSNDGRYLLAQAHIGGYEDWYELTPVIFDKVTGKWWKQDLKKVFAPYVSSGGSSECAIATHVQGFAPDGRVVVEASTFEWVEKKDCFPQSRWLLEMRTGEIERTAAH